MMGRCATCGLTILQIMECPVCKEERCGFHQVRHFDEHQRDVDLALLALQAEKAGARKVAKPKLPGAEFDQ